MQYQHDILKAINRILREAPTCQTEEQLGRLCLTVAEELTQSTFGFIGEINAQGQLEDIAISDPGMKRCGIKQPDVHKETPGDFTAHGIYGRVLLDGKGFFTNDPPSYPNSSGLPAGHPPLNAFLGVPLVSAGRIIGMVALGNRPNGYTEDELLALETLAPSMVQALLLKRAEDALFRLRDAEKQSRDERQRLYDVLETLPVYVILLTPDHYVPFANRYFRERFGESHGRRCYEYLFNRTEPCEVCGTYTVLQSGSPHRWEWTGPDSRTYDIFDFPFTDTDGSPLIMEVGIDITDLKRADAALREANEALERRVIERTEALRSSEERFRVAAECATDLIWDWDIRKGKLEWFGKVDELLGYAPGGFPRTIDAWEQLLHPDDHDRVMEILDRHLKNGDVYYAKYRVRRKDGSFGFWIDRGMAFRDENGTPYKMIGACSDITGREQAAQALRESREDLNHAQTVARIGSWRLDVAQKRLLLSGEAHHIFGNPQGIPVSYKSFLAIVHPEDRKYVDSQWKAALAGAPYDIEHRIVVDNAVKWVREKADLEFDRRGTLLGGIGITQDITERKRLEEEREHLLDKLMKSNRELEQFAYVASHDLQEPLRMVAGFTGLLAKRYKDKLDAQAQEFIHFAVDGAVRMQKLIEDLLAYSRVGSQELPFQPHDCNQLLDQAISNLHAAIEENHAIITRRDLPTVTCNDLHMVQLFQNLISNAIKFRGAETPRVQVSAEPRDGRWLFSLKDNGIGIDPRHKEQVFKIFQRLHSRDEYAGTGIGLALCLKIVELHKGTIWLESELGKGSTFYFTLPA